jgi:flagellar biosynthesis protein FliQ
MGELAVMDLGRNVIMTTLMLSAPMLIAALVVGVVVSVIQAITQINEVTLSFVPKILAVFAATALAGPWLMSTMLAYTVQLFTMLPNMAR